MEQLQAHYAKLVDQENKLLQKIDTVDGYLKVCLDYSSRTEPHFDINTGEDVLNAINEICNELRTELVFLRFEQALAILKINRMYAN